MRDHLPAASRGLRDVGLLLVGWCGMFALVGLGQAGLSPRRRLACLAIGLMLLLLIRFLEPFSRAAGAQASAGRFRAAASKAVVVR